jgi:hypothetical protein
MISFHVGQKVVCINVDGLLVEGDPPKRLVKGRLYTIALLEVRPDGVLRLRTTEHRSNFLDASRFRPVVARKTDISIFTNILNTQRVRTDA